MLQELVFLSLRRCYTLPDVSNVGALAGLLHLDIRECTMYVLFLPKNTVRRLWSGTLLNIHLHQMQDRRYSIIKSDHETRVFAHGPLLKH